MFSEARQTTTANTYLFSKRHAPSNRASTIFQRAIEHIAGSYADNVYSDL